MDKVVAINKHKLSNGRKPSNHKEVKNIVWAYLGGVQHFQFRAESDIREVNVVLKTLKRQKRRLQKASRTINRSRRKS